MRNLAGERRPESPEPRSFSQQLHSTQTSHRPQSMSWISNRDGGRDEEGKGILWKLPVVKNKDLGKLGPGFGAGVGCGVGLSGGVCFGFETGFPGLQIGFGIGGGCGIGIGFGYGVGRGVGYDERKKYSNAGKMFGNTGNLLPGTQLSTLLEDIAGFTERQIACARKQIADGARDLKKKLQNQNRGSRSKSSNPKIK